MRRRDFQRLVDSLKSLSPHQLHHLNETVSGRPSLRLSQRVQDRRQDPGGCRSADSERYPQAWAVLHTEHQRPPQPHQGLVQALQGSRDQEPARLPGLVPVLRRNRLGARPWRVPPRRHLQTARQGQFPYVKAGP